MHWLLSLGGWLLLHQKAQRVPVTAHRPNKGCNGCRSPPFNSTFPPPSHISVGHLQLHTDSEDVNGHDERNVVIPILQAGELRSRGIGDKFRSVLAQTCACCQS